MIKCGKEDCGTLRFIIFEIRDGCQRSTREMEEFLEIE